MSESLIGFKSRFLEKTIAFIWRQWSALGVSGHADNFDEWIIDPEALICITCLFGRYEPRLFDEAMDWLRENGGIINLSRLKRISDMEGLECSSILASVAMHLQKMAGKQKWKSLVSNPTDSKNPQPFFLRLEGRSHLPLFGKMDEFFQSHGWSRGAFQFSKKSQPAMGDGKTNMLIRLRTLMGVNARCEILAFLLDRGSSHPHEVARQTHYFTKTIQDAMVQMRLSRLVNSRTESGKKVYSTNILSWKPLLFPDNAFPRYLNWPVIFSSLAMLWREIEKFEGTGDDNLMVSAKLKGWARDAGPNLEMSGLTGVLRPESNYPGAAYLPVFLEDMGRWIG